MSGINRAILATVAERVAVAERDLIALAADAAGVQAQDAALAVSWAVECRYLQAAGLRWTLSRMGRQQAAEWGIAVAEPEPVAPAVAPTKPKAPRKSRAKAEPKPKAPKMPKAPKTPVEKPPPREFSTNPKAVWWRDYRKRRAAAKKAQAPMERRPMGRKPTPTPTPTQIKWRENAARQRAKKKATQAAAPSPQPANSCSDAT